MLPRWLVIGNESGEDGSSLTYDLPRKTERGKARHDSNQETGEISCELNKHYDVPANLPHPAARPRRVSFQAVPA